MAKITVAPTTAAPGTTVDVTGTGFANAKYDLTTVDAQGNESGRAAMTMSAAQDRPSRGGTFFTGINVPPVYGRATIRAYQNGVVVATADIMVADKPARALPFSPPR